MADVGPRDATIPGTFNALNYGERTMQCCAFLYIIDRKAREVYNTWTLGDDEKNEIDVLFEKFNTYCKPKHNVQRHSRKI